MKTVSLALIGDIHYPDYKSDVSIDLKDKGMSPKVISTIAPTKLKKVADEISRQLRENASIQAVLLCGDLTSNGNLNGYKECLSYLQSVLSLSNSEFWKDKHLHVVPGNHDINSSEINISDDIYKKFDAIQQAWVDINRAEMQPKTVRTSDIKDANSMTTIFSVNSCVGIGEYRNLPSSILTGLQKLIVEYSGKEGDSEVFDLFSEKLYTPAVDEKHIELIVDAIRKLQKLSGIPVLLAHHGLLPQATTRVQIYTELLNSGYVRFALASFGRPVIYCHGHLHNDTVEIITHPQQGFGRIITISAPLFIDGFNLVNLIFNDEGLALGCEVIPIRLKNGSIIEDSAIRIPLLVGENIISSDGVLRAALNATNGVTQRFGDIQLPTHDEESVSDALLELEWMGLVEINNRKEKPLHWQIRRTSP